MIKKNRESNIELLRIVLMVMILIHHLIVHGFGMLKIGKSTYTADDTIYYQLFVNSFVVIAVNVFVFISGYYGMKFKLRTTFSFVFQALFYSVGIYLLFVAFDHSLWDTKSFLNTFTPISDGVWWFLTIYLAMLFISPFINKGIDIMQPQRLKYILTGLLFFDCFAGFLHGTVSGNGYSIFHFITMYVLARYLKKYEIHIKNPILLLISFTLLIFLGSVTLFQMEKLTRIWWFFSYNNPLLIASSVMLFYTFKYIKLPGNKVINLISSSIFGIYLITEQEFIRTFIVNLVVSLRGAYSDLTVLIGLTVIIILLFAVCSLIELIRKYISGKIIDGLVTIWNTNDYILSLKGQWKIGCQNFKTILLR